MAHQGLSKTYRLKSRKLIQQIFDEGDTVKAYPVMARFVTEKLDTPSPFQVGFSVSKRRFKRAVDRNRIKRQMREAFRIHQHLLTESFSQQEESPVIMFIYLGKELPNFDTLEEKIIGILSRLAKKADSQ